MAAVKLAESYEEVGAALTSTFQEINSLIHSSKITVHGQEYLVEIFLGGDYKVKSWSHAVTNRMIANHNYIVSLNDAGTECCNWQLCMRVV